MSKKRPVLGDHKKNRRKLVPPVKAMSAPIQEVNYVRDSLPQFLWIALANDFLGYRDGIMAVRSLALSAFEHGSTADYSLPSSYRGLSDEEREKVRKDLDQASWLTGLQTSLAPLSGLYEGFPLAFLGLPEELDTKLGLTRRIRRVAEDIYDRWGDAAIMAQASSLAVRCSTGRHHFPQDMDLPDFNLIIADPDSDEGRRARILVRMSNMTLRNPLDEEAQEDPWPRSFWDQGLMVDECNLGGSDE